MKMPLMMGVLNVTPDSFSDGGEFLGLDKAVRRAEEMVREGAMIIDVGGESTGPGSKDVSVEEELKRVVPVVSELSMKFGRQSRKGLLSSGGRQSRERLLSNGGRQSRERLLSNGGRQSRDGGQSEVVISVDTYKVEVAMAAIEVGAEIVNDVTALRGGEGMAELIAETGVKVVLMYAKDDSARTTGDAVEYDDVMKTVKDFLTERIEFALSKGIKQEQIIVDPGMGTFVSGRSEYSLEILERLAELKTLGCRILVGASRKGFVGDLEVERDDLWQNVKLSIKNGQRLSVGERLEGSVACAVVAARNGADILRVHDVGETNEALRRRLI